MLGSAMKAEQQWKDSEAAKAFKVLGLAVLIAFVIIATRSLADWWQADAAQGEQNQAQQSAQLRKSFDNLGKAGREAVQDAYDKSRNHFGM
jgi:hypothetical protein